MSTDPHCNEALAEITASLSHLKLGEECKSIFAQYLLEERALSKQIRSQHLTYTRPFIDAGIVAEEDFDGLPLEEIRALIWQVRRRLDPEDPLRHARIPKLSPELRFF
jgi:hypothetical protein